MGEWEERGERKTDGRDIGASRDNTASQQVGVPARANLASIALSLSRGDSPGSSGIDGAFEPLQGSTAAVPKDAAGMYGAVANAHALTISARSARERADARPVLEAVHRRLHELHPTAVRHLAGSIAKGDVSLAHFEQARDVVSRWVCALDEGKAFGADAFLICFKGGLASIRAVIAAEQSGGESPARAPAVQRWGQADRAHDTVEAVGRHAVEQRAAGTPVDAGLAASVARHTGADVSGARVHTDSVAQQANDAMGARAFASGNDVFLGRGESATDARLMGHELAHVAQQQQGGASGPQLKGGDGGSTGSLEAHADAVGDKVAADHDQPAGAPPTTKPPGASYPVFADTGKPYKIVSASDPVQFWVVNAWVRAGAGFVANGKGVISPACATEILVALGWVAREHIPNAAKNLVFDTSRPVAQVTMAASAFRFTGMPSGKPIVSRASADMVQVATKLANADVPADTVVEIDDDQRLEMIRALAAFTGLQAADDALARLKANPNPKFHSQMVEAGVLRWDIDAKTGDEIFGTAPDTKHGGRYSQWLHGKQDAKPANESDKPKLKLSNYYGQPVPGTPTVDRKLVEAGTPVWLQVAVKWPSTYPSTDDYEVVPMVTPGFGGNVSLLTCAWSIVPTDGSGAEEVHTDTEVGELHHAFMLPKGRESGTFKVTIHASFPEYFEPAVFSLEVTVKSTAAAMEQLGGEAFADLGAKDVQRTPETFGVHGSGDDKEGSRTSGQLPSTFVPSSLDAPDPRSEARVAERKRLEAVRMYLEAHGAQKDVLAALDRELAASRATEQDLQSDRTRGFQPFQVRGTYLSRTDGVPSGPLTLYGSVRTTKVRMENGGFAPGGIVVQIRDLSRRFDNADMMFTGIGATFEEALKGAFLDNAKAYPKGVMEIEAEAIDAAVTEGKGEIGKANGRTLGFQLGTDSTWKRAKERVFSPIANIATNLAAMALMAFVPGSATVVAPLLIAYNTAPTVDRLRTESERGTLSFGTVALSAGEIALNLLPLAGKAKPFTKGWYLLETANWGGQAILMGASAVQVARELQAQDAEALAGLYEEMQKLEASGADPAAIEAKRQQVMERAKKVSDRIDEQITEQIGHNALLAVAGSVIHHAGTETQRARLLDDIVTRGSGAASMPASTTEPPAEGIADPTATGRQGADKSIAREHAAAQGVGDAATSSAESAKRGPETVTPAGGAHGKNVVDDATRAGADGGRSSNGDAKQAPPHHEATENAPDVATRAKAAYEKLDPTERKQADALIRAAKSPVQRNMLERAVAAGRNSHELDRLRAAMSDMSDGDIAKAFTGQGVVQFYEQSCVPTAYQIAIADVDPYYAFELRQKPEMVMDEQRRVLQDNDAQQTKRVDVANNKPLTNVKPHVDDASMGRKLKDPSSYDNAKGDKGGIEATQMAGSGLQSQLEKATGHSYETLTNASFKFTVEGQGKFANGASPHERIRAAVEAGLPVILSQRLPGMPGGHAFVIIGHESRPGGHLTYVLRDPMSGTVTRFEGTALDRLGIQAVTLPASGEHAHGAADVPAAKEEAGGSRAGAVHDASENASWSDNERQLEKPAPETEEAARERRSHGLTPSGKNAEKWATPEARQGIPETVPLSRQELRDLLTEKYHATMERYLSVKERTNNPKYADLIERLRNEVPGTISREKGAAYLAEWTQISSEIEAETGKSENTLRTLYSLVEREDFPVWYEQLKPLPKEQQAKLGHMWRQEWKIYIRDMMTDEGSKEVLYLRDRAMSGDRRGASFEDLYARGMRKPQATKESTYDGIIKTSMTSNPEVNKSLTGSASGVNEDVATKVRASAVEPTGKKQYDSSGNIITPHDQSTRTGGGQSAAAEKPHEHGEHTVDDAKFAKLDEIERSLASGDPVERTHAQSELDVLRKDPAYKDALDIRGLFETAKQNQKVGPATETFSDNISATLEGAVRARLGKDPALQAKREKFERVLAVSILKEGPVRAAIDADLARMCEKAHDYILQTRSSKAEQDAAIGGLGTDSSKGYAGGVGKGTEVMLDVLKNGNIRERMLALQNFMQMMGTDALTSRGFAKLEAIAANPAAKSDASFTAADAQRLVDRVLQLDEDLKNNPRGKRDVKSLINPMEEERAGRHHDFTMAKQQDMDTKLPPMIAEKVSAFLGRKVAADGTGHTGGGETNPLARTTVTVREAIAQGLELSEREIQAAGGLDAPLNWVVGSKANLVDPKAPFIAAAKEASMPLKAGISGTTYRWMEVVELLGGDPNLGRLAALSSLQAADAHSFHEIASAAKGFGIAYDVNEPYANIGIPKEQLEVLAKSIGTTHDELNGKPVRSGGAR